jgi:separase
MFLVEIHARLCSLLNAQAATSHLEIPQSSPPTDAVLLTLISTYLVYALVIKTQPHGTASKAIEDLVSVLSSPTRPSLLVWVPAFTTLPPKHVDSLLTRAYTSLTKLCSFYSTPSTPPSTVSKSKSSTSPSPESLFTLRMYALRCLAHTSPGVIEVNTFWDQARRFAAALVKSSQLSSEEQTTRMILTSYDELIQLAEKRSDRDTYMAIGDDGKSFVAFCEYWSSFAKRVCSFLFSSSAGLIRFFIGRGYYSPTENQLFHAACHAFLFKNDPSINLAQATISSSRGYPGGHQTI